MGITAGEARTRLEGMLQWQSSPALSSTEVDTLYSLAKRTDAHGTEPDAYADWKAATVYALNALAVPRVRNGYVYKATAISGTGTSAATEPTWPTVIGQTVIDNAGANQITWTCLALAPWVPTFNLRAAAAEGWEWKAGKVVKDYDVKAGSVTAQRNQQYQACMKKAAFYRGGQLVSVPVTSGTLSQG